MYEILINNVNYTFNFGMGFLRELNKMVKNRPDGFNVDKNVGFIYYLANLLDGDTEALATILYVANKGQDPRLTPALLDSFIDDPDTDIEELFDKVTDFLKNANSTRKVTANMLAQLERARA